MYRKSVPPFFPRCCFATIAILTYTLPSLSSTDFTVPTVVTYSQTWKKKKESTSTVRMIIKLKEEDETEFLFSFRFNQFPLNGTLFRLKPARYLVFCDTLFIILMQSQNRHFSSHTGQTCYELHHRSMMITLPEQEKGEIRSWFVILLLLFVPWIIL